MGTQVFLAAILPRPLHRWGEGGGISQKVRQKCAALSISVWKVFYFPSCCLKFQLLVSWYANWDTTGHLIYLVNIPLPHPQAHSFQQLNQVASISSSTPTVNGRHPRDWLINQHFGNRLGIHEYPRNETEQDSVGLMGMAAFDPYSSKTY